MIVLADIGTLKLAGRQSVAYRLEGLVGTQVALPAPIKVDSADRHTHGAHGRGRSEERDIDPSDPAPDETRESDRGGSAAWGHAPSGGSIIDKRKPEK